jgi:hypothetical protein
MKRQALTATPSLELIRLPSLAAPVLDDDDSDYDWCSWCNREAQFKGGGSRACQVHLERLPAGCEVVSC